MFDLRTCAIPTLPNESEAMASQPGVNNSPVSLQTNGIADHFRIWRGVSRTRYVFSVYSTTECPPYENAVAILARVESDGRRRALRGIDTGDIPELALGAFRRLLSGDEGRHEIHVHVCARSAAARHELLRDLGIPVVG